MILVVEDEPIYQKLITNSLVDTGCEIDVASDGYQALQKIKENKYILAVIDLVLPGAINGIDIIKQLKKESPETPIIVCSGYGSHTVQTKIEKAGANDFLIKPFTPEQMYEKVRSLLSGIIDFDKIKQPAGDVLKKPAIVPEIIENFPENKINEILSLGAPFELSPPDRQSVNFTDSITIIISGIVECFFNDKPIGELHEKESIGHESLMKNIDNEMQIEMIAKSNAQLLVIPKVEFLKYFCHQTNELLSILEKNIKKILPKNLILKAGIKLKNDNPPNDNKSTNSKSKNNSNTDNFNRIDLIQI